MTEPAPPPPPIAPDRDSDGSTATSAVDVPAVVGAPPAPASFDAGAPGSHPWSEPDRPRGLDAWFAPGGEDAATEERVKDERRLVWLMVVMVALLVGVPTVLTLLAFVGQILALRSGG